MATTVNKMIGTLSIGTTTPVNIEAQVSKIGTPQTVTRDAPVTVLTGDVVTSAATYSWALSGEMLLDLSNKTGAYYSIRAMMGQTQPFTFHPIGTTGPTITGNCIIDGFDTEELNAGAIAVSKFAWPVQGQITVTPPP
jgi:hypothetical protein